MARHVRASSWLALCAQSSLSTNPWREAESSIKSAHPAVQASELSSLQRLCPSAVSLGLTFTQDKVGHVASHDSVRALAFLRPSMFSCVSKMT